ncbi:deoxyribose-phosphate aldolase [bacterium BMS3Abin05]|nr:deoxyribose-phosphate aldolase [bacterium BMS3Abin05]GBE28198.1 deoxyribose-phosphate aldolase [bacterium BMS3Bbin03]HDK35553.1 deoxyribose-phosphate aldolase [Bacteroidota bacterium]
MAPETLIIAMGSDHAGFDLKNVLKDHLSEKGWTVIDCGTFGKEAVDYPKYAAAVAKKVSDGEAPFGIVIDGAGIGSAMAANKIHGVRAALCYDLTTAKNAREHNNANVLTLGAGLIGPALAMQIADTFLSTECTVDRYLRRVEMINNLDRGTDSLTDIAPSEHSDVKEENALELTDADIEKIAERIRGLLFSRRTMLTGTQQALYGDQVPVNFGYYSEKTPEIVRNFIDLGADRISHVPGEKNLPQDIAKYIDYTLLRPEAAEEEIKKLCAEARDYQFASVCINPTYVPLCARELAGSGVAICTVAGFPLGTHMPEIKAMEARRSIRDGASEIDMVINIGALKSNKDDLVYHDIRMVVEACEDGDAISKVIIEAALLTDDEKVRACQLAKRARANYVKTSTGFGPGGATAKDVALMSQVVQSAGMGVKAAGGIHSFEDAQKMIAAGATRIGASAGIKIVQEAKSITISE